MENSERSAMNIFGYFTTIIFGGLSINRGWITLGWLFCIIGVVGIVYEIYKYANKERSSTAAMGTAICAVIVPFGMAYITIPEVNEEVNEGGVIIPTYTATVTIEVENHRWLETMDCKIYQDNKLIDEISIKPLTTYTKTINVVWKGSPSQKFDYKLIGTGGWFKDSEDSYSVILSDKSIRTVKLNT